jgi:hypothetical protein
VAEYADQIASGPWPGIGSIDPFPIRLVVVRSDARFDSLTAGRLPSWSGAAAFPRTNTIVIKISGNPRVTVRHELAHLVLSRVAPRSPTWFHEGYAALAAGEWGRLDVLGVNWALASGVVPTFRRLDRELRSGPSHARAAYALATTAVLYLQRLGGERGLGPLIGSLGATGDLDLAVRRAHLITLDQLQDRWQKELRRRYGWLLIFSSFAVFWGVIGLVVGLVWLRRRKYDRERRAALDEGWIVPANEADEPA